MRAAGWLAAVLCPLALLGAGSRGLRFHPGQGKGAATKEEAAGGCRGAAEGAAELGEGGSFWRAVRLGTVSGRERAGVAAELPRGG